MRPPAQTSPETDREALIAFFNATDGESWDSSGTWLGRAPIGEWPGVTTNGQGRVIGLNLSNLDAGLTGELPPELGNLTMLQSLSLTDWSQAARDESFHQLSGEIPPELGNLANLQSLNLSFHQLSGEIPPELGNLDNLQWLDLGGNQLCGEIPAELGNLGNLNRLDLNGNQLCGEIPAELGNLSNLNGLILYGNQLSGAIPAELGDLSNLNRLELNGNQLSGEIPPELGNLSNLNELSLYDNQLSGGIPPELGDLSNINWLYLFNNQLSGAIPPELENLLYLEPEDAEYWLEWLGRIGINLLPRERDRVINLSHNQFSGCISDYASDFHDGWNSGLPVCTPPDHPGDTETLIALYEALGLPVGLPGLENWLGRAPLAEWEGVSVDAGGRVEALVASTWDLGLTWPLVPELGNLDNLRVLVITGGLSGIPQELGNLANLQLLAVVAYPSGIPGEIPPELGNLTNLQLLLLVSGGHGLSGEIPAELGNLTNLRVLNLRGNDGLSGCVPASLREQDVTLEGARFCP